MKLRRILLSSARKALARVPARFFWTERELFVPLYHMVADESPPHLRAGYDHHTVASFERQIDELLREFRPVELRDIVASIRGQSELPARAMFVTFDDGLRQIGELAAPILSRKGVPAAIFVPTACVDNRALTHPHTGGLILDRLDRGVTEATQRAMAAVLESDSSHVAVRAAVLTLRYRERGRLVQLAELLDLDLAGYLERERPYQSSEELTRLAAAGFVIGGHSIDHPKYRELSVEEQVRQTEVCMKFVVDAFAPTVRAFAFPFGDLGVNDAFFDRMQRGSTFDISFGTARLRDDRPGHVQRLPMDTLRGPMPRILSAAYSERWGRRVAGRNRLQRD